VSRNWRPNGTENSAAGGVARLRPRRYGSITATAANVFVPPAAARIRPVSGRPGCVPTALRSSETFAGFAARKLPPRCGKTGAYAMNARKNCRKAVFLLSGSAKNMAKPFLTMFRNNGIILYIADEGMRRCRRYAKPVR